jgi:transcriptional regulator with XRE-family HTH domain
MEKIRNVRVSDEMAELLREVSEEEWAAFEYMQNVSDQIAEYMEKQGVSRAELARRLDTSKAFVTKVLRGDANMTMKTLVKVLHALDAAPQTRVAPKDDRVQWFGIVEGQRKKMRKRQRGAVMKTPKRRLHAAFAIDENQARCA